MKSKVEYRVEEFRGYWRVATYLLFENGHEQRCGYTEGLTKQQAEDKRSDWDSRIRKDFV